MIGDTVAKIRVKAFIYHLLNQVYGIRHSIFRTLEVILRLLEVRLPRYFQKPIFADFEIGFTAFFILFLEYYRLFYLYWRYFCQDTGDNVYLPAFKLGLLFSPFYFKKIEGYFASILSTLVLIRPKNFICKLLIWVYAIFRSIFRTLKVILRWLEVQLPRYGWKRLFSEFKIRFTEFAVLYLEH